MTQQTEYRISVTTKVKVNGHGDSFRLITVRGDSIEETEALYRQLLARLPAWDASLEARETRYDAQETASNRRGVSQYHPSQNGRSDAPFCNAHSVAYRRYEKDGKAWYAHKHGQGWCRLRTA